MIMKTIEIENGEVQRKFTKEWEQSGFINMNQVPKMVESIVMQKKEMIEYIEALHDKIDFIIEETGYCDVCEYANCGSDHK